MADTWVMKIILGLGGNVGDVRSAFDRAVSALGECPGVAVRDRSSLWRTAAIGPEQPNYLNAAIMVSVETSPRDLLSLCHHIEAAAGRDRRAEVRWGPRTLDLDLLIADTMICRGPLLELPHPRLAERAFALVPAAEVAPEWIHPLEGRTLAELAEKVRPETPEGIGLVGPWSRT
jgi:2-amino-4-hydroxy-6-hydroxymethyldihydropteridine diphosphokinase